MSQANIDTLIIVATILATAGVVGLCSLIKSLVTWSGDEPTPPEETPVERERSRAARAYGPLEQDTPSLAEESGW